MGRKLAKSNCGVSVLCREMVTFSYHREQEGSLHSSFARWTSRSVTSSVAVGTSDRVPWTALSRGCRTLVLSTGAETLLEQLSRVVGRDCQDVSPNSTALSLKVVRKPCVVRNRSVP